METLFPLWEPQQRVFSLRDYQQRFIRSYKTTMVNPGDMGLLIAATGLGKTEVAGAIMGEEDSTLLITPFIETTGQTADRLRGKGLDVGVEQGVLTSDKKHTVACWPSLLSRRRFEKYVGCTALVIVDEVHLNFTDKSREILDALRDGGAKILGMTATPHRAGNVLQDYFKNIIADYRIPQATRDGWLVEGRVWLTVVESLDLSDWHMTYGGYGDLAPPKNGESLHSLMAREATVQSIASSIYQHNEGQPSLVFCAGVAQANRLVECLWDRGIVASIVHSKMDDVERRRHLADFEAGKNNVIVNIGCLAIGYDFPPIRKLFLARPTANKNRFTQMVGRATRPLAGVVDGWSTPEQRKRAIADSAKPFFECFDITDASRRCDLLSAIDLLISDEDADVVKRTKEQAAKAGRALNKPEIDLIADEERRAIAAEREAALAMEIRRNGAVIGAEFGVYSRDQFAQAEGIAKPRHRGWHILWGKFKSWPLPDAVTKDPAWVRWHLGKLHPKQEAYAAAILRELRRQGK